MHVGTGGSELAGLCQDPLQPLDCKVPPNCMCPHRPGFRSGSHLEAHSEEPQHCSRYDPQTWAAFTGRLDNWSSNPLHHSSMLSHHLKSRCDRQARRPTVHLASPCRLQTFAPRHRDIVAGIELCRASFVSSCQAAGGKALAQDSNTPTCADASHGIAVISVANRTDAGAAVRTTVLGMHTAGAAPVLLQR
jgi:hypothetical protein